MYILGSGCTKFSDQWDKDAKDLVCDSIEIALRSSGIYAQKIEAVWLANCLNPLLAKQYNLCEEIATQLNPKLSVFTVYGNQTCSIKALFQAYLALRAGIFSTVAVCGVEKMSDWSEEDLTTAATAFLTPEEQKQGLTIASGYGIIANSYLHKYNYPANKLSLITVKNHKNALRNKLAQFNFEISAEKINQSPLFADPIRFLHASASCDGACAIILSGEKSNKERLKISSIGFGTDSMLSNRKSLSEFSSTQKAVKNLFPKNNFQINQIDFFELDDSFAIGEILALEDLKLFPKGQAIRENRSKFFINQSGGLKAFGNPFAASGLRQIYTVIEQLKKNSRACKGLTQIIGGVGHEAAVCLIEKEK